MEYLKNLVIHLFLPYFVLLDKQNIMKDSLGVGFGRTSKPCEKKISVILAFEFS